MALFVAGSAIAADPVPPARIYPQIPSSEPAFQSSNKPQTAAPLILAQAKTKKDDALKPDNKEMMEPVPATDALKGYPIQYDPPSPEMLFGRLDSERRLEQRMRQQAIEQNPANTVKFPENAPISKTAFQGRTFPQAMILAEPHVVCYNRLYFEEKNSERYGWDLGFIQPVVSLAYFYKDVVFLPHNIMSHPFQRTECSAGYCLPGDPVPYILYPPKFTLTGSIFEGAVAVGLIAAFP